MLSKETGELEPRPPNQRHQHHQCLYYMNVGVLLEANHTVTPDMEDSLTPMYNLMNCKIIEWTSHFHRRRHHCHLHGLRLLLSV